MEEFNAKTFRLSKHHLAILALIIANTIWGAASPIFKWSLQDIQPFTLAFLRFFIGALIILPFTLHNLHIKRSDWIKLTLVSLTGITVNISFYFVALELTQSINAPIIASSAPIFIILGSILFLHEKPKKNIFLGTTISLLGVIAIIIEPLLEKGLDASIIGNLLLIVSMLSGVIETILLRGLARGYSALTITFWTFILGAIPFLPMVVVESQGNGFLADLTIKGLIGIVFGAVLCSALAYYLYTLALKYMIASETSVFTYMDPIITILIAIPLLGEKITPVFIAGSVLVFGGILLAERRLNWHPIRRLFKIPSLSEDEEISFKTNSPI